VSRVAIPRRIVLGIGNPDRGDDAAGREVARRLRGAWPEGVVVAEVDGEATDLLARLDGADAAYLIDACVSGAPAGTVHRIDAAHEPIPPGAFGVSTHGLGLAAAIGLARALGRLPARCVVYAIEGASFETGAPLSPAVADAVGTVAGRLRDELSVLQPVFHPIEETPHA
jgi:hydrogenase maturation protease